MKKLLTIFLVLGLFALVLNMGPRSEAKKRKGSAPSMRHRQPATKQPPQQQMQELSEATKTQLYALMVEKQSRTAVEQKIDSQLIMGAKMQRQEPIAPGIASMDIDVESDSEGRDEVDISAEVTDKLSETIRQQGGQIVNTYPQFNAVRAHVTPESLETIASLSEVRFINRAARVEVSQTGSVVSSNPGSTFEQRAQQVKDQLSAVLPAVVSVSPGSSTAAPGSISAIVPSTGSVTSEGDVTHAANQARTSFNVDGSGIKIGVLSDSVKFLAQSQANGNLPTVTVLSGRSGVDGGKLDTGEGTAMLEIIADLAPGAQLFFSTGKGGPAAFAQNILDLQAAGCNIIVDDLEYFNESPFQDDVVAQAVNTVTAAGVLYFSSAGNSGNFDDQTSSVWEGDFVDGGPVSSNGTVIGTAHRFAAPNVILNPAFVPSNQEPVQTAFLFWSDPLQGSSNDYDLYVVNSSGTIVRSSNNTQNGSQSPMESVDISDGEQILVVKFSGANRYLHVNVGRGTFTYQKPGRTKGHSATVNAFSVAAVKARTSFPNTFTGGDVNPIETFSSDGPRRIFFNPDGSAITPGNFSSAGGTIRAKPDIAAADGVSTSVSGFGTFYGTSAAAPHAAAIAALLLSFKPSLTPVQVRTALTSTALDNEASGADYDSGAGIAMALQALQAVSSCAGVPIAAGQTINGSLSTSDCFFTGTTRYVEIYNFSGTTGQQIAITMNSSAFDSFLYLLDSTNHTVAQDDDGGGGTNSRIPATSGFFTLPTTGAYKIYATSFAGDGTGAYTINFTVSNCSFSLNPTTQIFISSASTGSFSVSTTSNCSWTAVSNASWLTTGSSGTGNGIVNYSVAANTGNSRTGTMSVGGQNFTVFQSAGNGNGCPSTTLMPGQVITATLTTGCVFTGTSRYVDPYNFSGTAGQRIALTMNSSAFDTYLFMDSPASQTIARDDDGGGGTNSRIPANAGFFTLPLTGTYNVYATSFSPDGTTGSTGAYTIGLLTATSCSYSISPTNQSVGAPSSGNSFTITAQSGCTWTALSNASWITTSSSGTGGGTINYSFAANPGIARTGTISIGGLLFTVNQSAGTGSTVQFSAAGYSVGEAAGFINITVTRSAGSSGTTNVSYATSNGTAKEGRNYVAAIGAVSFAGTETSKTFPVLVIDNAFVDGARTVNLALTSPSGATLGAPGTAVLTINDNDSGVGSNPVDTPRSFVQFNYYDFLARYPDTGGWDFWTNQITSCGTNTSCTDVARINTSGAFFLSIEFQQTGYLVERMYKTAYGDGSGRSSFGGVHQLPVPAVRFDEFLRDTQRVGQGVVVLAPGWEQLLESNKQTYANEFVQTSRFSQAFPSTMTPTEFIDRLNQNAGNVLSASEQTTAIGLFGGAADSSNLTARAQTVRQVAEDPDLVASEKNRAFVLAQYFGYLRRDPNSAPDTDYTGYDFWLTKLNQFNGDYINAEMVKAFISSSEYRQRFGP
jgi:hypothetical protein